MQYTTPFPRPQALVEASQQSIEVEQSIVSSIDAIVTLGLLTSHSEPVDDEGSATLPAYGLTTKDHLHMDIVCAVGEDTTHHRGLFLTPLDSHVLVDVRRSLSHLSSRSHSFE